MKRMFDDHKKEYFLGDIVRCFGGEKCQGFYEYDEYIRVSKSTLEYILNSDNVFRLDVEHE